MAVSRVETTIVLGLLGLVVAGVGSVGWSIANHPSEPAEKRAPAQNEALPQPPAPPSTANTEPQAPPPFVATAQNEAAWKPEILPVDWPSFTKLPDEKPLAPKPTKLKIDGARSILMRWDAFSAGKSKTYPSDKEVDAATKYLMTIERSDLEFPSAWATFIKLRQAAREIWKLTERQEVEKQAAERKRKAKTEGVSVGMTQEEAIGSSWGKPKSINSTITASGRHEQWVYGGSNYLYFDNGRLTSIQTGH
jgi:hypothetical protein